MRKKEFIEACLSLREESMTYTEDGKLGNSDGVISPGLYYDNPGIKILWLLKEAWGDGHYDQAGELSKVTKADDFFETRNSDGFQTYKPMILLSSMVNRLDISDVYTSAAAYSYFLKSTAFVNCKKIPGTSTSNINEIRDNALKNKDLIRKQVLLYKPSVIIGGNTLRYFFPVNSSQSSIFEQIKLFQNGKPAKGLNGITAFSVFGDTVLVNQCQAIKKYGFDFGVYAGERFLFIDADHPSYAKSAEDYCAALCEIINGQIYENDIIRW